MFSDGMGIFIADMAQSHKYKFKTMSSAWFPLYIMTYMRVIKISAVLQHS